MAVLSPVAVVKNGLILATIWRRDFARTLLHIFLCRLAITDLLGDLIGGPPSCFEDIFFQDFVLIFYDYLSSDREALSFSSPLLLLTWL